MSPDAPSVGVASAADGPRLKRTQSLQFKLGVLFFTVAVLLSIGAWWIGRLLVQDNLVEDTRRYQRESGLRLAEEINGRMARAESLAGTVAALVAGGEASGWKQRIPALVDGSGLGSLVAAVGVWPEAPKGADASTPRASVLWLADSAGVLQSRADYNDPRAIAYWNESWYTPARFAPKGACHWTTAFVELLSKRTVVGCTLPLRDERGFAGAVTVLLDVEALDRVFQDAAAGQSGYALLADRENRLLGMTGSVVTKVGKDRPRNLAALAQKLPSFNTLALELHSRDDAFLSKAVQSPLYDAAQISALKEATREGSRQDAESALALIWNGGRPNAAADAPLKEILIEDDAILGETASATVLELPQPFWKLVRVTRAREGVAGARYFFTQTLVVVCGAVFVILLLVFAGLRLLVLRPLNHMATRLSDARTLEQSLHLQLDASAGNEIGLIGHWYNERVRQLRDAMDRTATQQAQLMVESAERMRLDEQSVRARERGTSLIGSVGDGVIMIDAKGLIEEINGPAEQLLAVQARNVRGRPLDEVFRVRLPGSDTAQSDLASTVLAATSRIDHTEGVFLAVEGRAERELTLSALPMRSPGGRSLGATFVFRSREIAGAATKLVIDRRSVDAVTGLPSRAACDRRLRALQ
ncbi:MAG TPA: PAS domain-containing protein, partial [Nevskiaceae bacterium]|nr:PAS domain-containing protein [Nevskiaceae bacterium]